MATVLLLVVMMAKAQGQGPQFNLSSRVCPGNGPCGGMTLTCPSECPSFKLPNVKGRACFFNCGNKCEAHCRKTKADCESAGAACYDPRFIGGDGIMFYFHGKSSQNFALVSDRDIHINAHFIGHRPEGRSRDFTWIKELGILFRSHTFSISANNVTTWTSDVDHLLLAHDGIPVELNEGYTSTWSSSDGLVHVDRTARVNSITLTLPGLVEIMATVVSVTEEDDRIHNYRIPSGDSFAHLEVQFRFAGLSEDVEGVLGQTYRPDYRSPVKRGLLMPVMGGEDKYKTVSVLSSECARCIFEPVGFGKALPGVTGTFDCIGNADNGYGVVCRR